MAPGLTSFGGVAGLWTNRIASPELENPSASLSPHEPTVVPGQTDPNTTFYDKIRAMERHWLDLQGEARMWRIGPQPGVLLSGAGFASVIKGRPSPLLRFASQERHQL